MQSTILKGLLLARFPVIFHFEYQNRKVMNTKELNMLTIDAFSAAATTGLSRWSGDGTKGYRLPSEAWQRSCSSFCLPAKHHSHDSIQNLIQVCYTCMYLFLSSCSGYSVKTTYFLYAVFEIMSLNSGLLHIFIYNLNLFIFLASLP